MCLFSLAFAMLPSVPRDKDYPVCFSKSNCKSVWAEGEGVKAKQTPLPGVKPAKPRHKGNVVCSHQGKQMDLCLYLKQGKTMILVLSCTKQAE